MAKRSVGLLLVANLSACVHPAGNPQAQPEDPQLDWNDLMSVRVELPRLFGLRYVPGTTLTPKRLASLPPVIARQRPLAKLVVERHLAAVEPFGRGALGRQGSAKVFVATRAAVPNEHQLYWMVVKVLSERYSCFMTHKQTVGSQIRFRCRDSRYVLFETEQTAGYTAFYGRQFDADGYEIEVKRRRMLRISANPVFHPHRLL